MKPKRAADQKPFRTRGAWRAWLETNHARRDELWLVYFKKDSGTPSVSYAEAVEEAICFGWIDGQVQAIDAARYMQRFTPRRPKSGWSAINLERADRMIAAGLMRDAGHASLPADRATAKIAMTVRQRLGDEFEIPAELRKALRGAPAARKFFASLTLARRRDFVGWVTAAKRPETRAKRVAESIRLLSAGEKLGPR